MLLNSNFGNLTTSWRDATGTLGAARDSLSANVTLKLALGTSLALVSDTGFPYSTRHTSPTRNLSAATQTLWYFFVFYEYFAFEH